MKFEERFEKIKDYLIKKLDPEVIILFGSRAKGCENYGSDIDIAIKCKDISFREERKIKEEIDKIAGIYSVDIIFINKVSKDFQYKRRQL